MVQSKGKYKGYEWALISQPIQSARMPRLLKIMVDGKLARGRLISAGYKLKQGEIFTLLSELIETYERIKGIDHKKEERSYASSKPTVRTLPGTRRGKRTPHKNKADYPLRGRGLGAQYATQRLAMNDIRITIP